MTQLLGHSVLTCKHHYKIISQGSGNFLAYTPCSECHVQNKLTGLRRVHVEISSIVCIINLLITLVANVLMMNLETVIVESNTCAW